MRKNKLAKMIALGMLHMADAPISFAGVPNNFAFAPGGGNNGQAAPLSGANGVPAPVVSLPNTQSKVNPGVTSTSTADPNTNPALVNGIPKGSSPLDKFAGLFDNKPQVDDKGNPIKPPANVLDAGVASYAEIAKKLNFGELMNPEQKAAFIKGGEGAVEALGQVLNNFGQQIFAHAAATSTAVTKKGLTEHSAQQQEVINQAIKMNGLSESLLNKDPRLANPAVAPLVSVVQQQIAAKNPGLTTQQLEGLVIEYFTTSFAGFGGPTPAEKQVEANKKPEVNFLELLTGGTKK